MPDIKEVINMMIADGKSDADIRAVIDRYNKSIAVKAETPVDTEVATEEPPVEETAEEAVKEETAEKFDWRNDENKTQQELDARDDEFFEIWNEINPDSKLTRDEVVNEKKKSVAKDEEEPVAAINTSDPLMNPYLMDENQLVSQASSTAVPQSQEGQQEETTRKQAEITAVENQALIDLNNYKEKNRHQFKEVISNQDPNFPTDNGNITLAPIGSTVTEGMNEKLMMDHIKNNKEIQEVIIPSLYTDNQKAIENKIKGLRNKYGDGVNFYSKADYEEAQKELNTFVSGFLFYSQ